jgi:Fur family transcriptional regulator, ferric uptake regulator
MASDEQLALPAGVRLTAQRRALLDTIDQWDGSFTALELHERTRRREPSLGIATTYRTLELLRAAGSIRALAGQEQRTYVRCHPGHHHHLVCVECGSVEETELCAAPSQAELSRRHGFAAASHELDIYGTCARCRAA